MTVLNDILPIFCPVCTHEWSKHATVTTTYNYYGSKETYDAISISCTQCGAEGIELPVCLWDD